MNEIIMANIKMVKFILAKPTMALLNQLFELIIMVKLTRVKPTVVKLTMVKLVMVSFNFNEFFHR
jgi:hypothetical protein